MRLVYFLAILFYTNQLIVCQQYVSSSLLHHRKFLNSPSNYKNLDNDFDAMLNEIESVESGKPVSHQSNLADMFLRDKKSKNHRYDTQEPLTCSAKFKKEQNVIVDSKASVNNGAELMMPIRYITPEMASKGLNAMHDACMQICCETAGCDTALLSTKVGLVC
jgi:hypothetical protein